MQLKKDLDTFEASPSTAPLSLQGQISATLTSFSKTIDEYRNIASQELVHERKEKAQGRIEKFHNELVESRERLRELKLQREESLVSLNRSALLERRPGHSSTPENPYDSRASDGVSTGGSFSRSQGYTNMTRAEGLSREQDVFGRAGQQLDEFLERGRTVLGDLNDQNQMLRSTKRKIYDVANTLGISNHTIRMVEKRAFEDKFVFYGGIIFMLVCFYYILRWFG